MSTPKNVAQEIVIGLHNDNPPAARKTITMGFHSKTKKGPFEIWIDGVPKYHGSTFKADELRERIATLQRTYDVVFDEGFPVPAGTFRTDDTEEGETMKANTTKRAKKSNKSSKAAETTKLQPTVDAHSTLDAPPAATAKKAASAKAPAAKKAPQAKSAAAPKLKATDPGYDFYSKENIEVFNSLLGKENKDGCIIWKGTSTQDNKIGLVRFGGMEIRTFRYVAGMKSKVLPDSKAKWPVKCDNGLCCTAAHIGDRLVATPAKAAQKPNTARGGGKKAASSSKVSTATPAADLKLKGGKRGSVSTEGFRHPKPSARARK